MSTKVSKKINNAVSKVINTPYKGRMNSQHLCVGLNKGRIMTPVGYNYHRSMVFGELKGSLHAEMAVVYYLINLYSGVCDFNYRKSYTCVEAILRDEKEESKVVGKT